MFPDLDLFVFPRWMQFSSSESGTTSELAGGSIRPQLFKGSPFQNRGMTYLFGDDNPAIWENYLVFWGGSG